MRVRELPASRSIRLSRFASVITIACCSTTGLGQDAPPPDPSPESSPDQPVEEAKVLDEEDPKSVLSDDAVFGYLEYESARDAWWKRSPIGDLWDQGADSIEEAIGLRIGFAFTGLYQASTNSDGGSEASSFDLDLFGTWHLVGSEDEGNAGYLGFATEWRERIGNRPPSALGSEFGALSRTTQSFNEFDYSLVEIWWSQEFLDRKVALTAGKVSPRSFYNSNRLRNQNTTFLNQVFTGNRAVGLPGRGPGANVTLRPSTDWYVSAGVQDTNGTASTNDFDDLQSDRLAYLGEVGWTPTIDGLGRGNYRLTAWSSDPSDVRGTGRGEGIALSFDQDLGEHFICSTRYAYADGDATSAKQTLSGAIGLTDPFDREDDLVAIGAGWSDPASDRGRDEYVFEIFYRMQVTPRQQLSVDWQTYIDPAFDSDESTVGVFSVRWRVQF